MNVAVRRATPGDAALLAAHRALVWDDGGHDPVRTRAQVPVWTAWMRDAIVRDEYVAFIAADGERTIGSASLLVQLAVPRPGYRGDRDGRVHGVWVEPGERRAGVARAMMRELIAYARATDLMRLALHPTDVARPLYVSLGFEALDEMGLYFGD